MASPRFKLYITNKNYSSWSLRIWLLMKHFSIPFEEVMQVMVECTPTSTHQAHFYTFSPTGKVPCLHDLAPHSATSPSDSGASTIAENEPLVIAESLAITEYLAETHPHTHIWPADLRARAFARAACGEISTGLQALRDELSSNMNVRIQLGPEEPSPALAKNLDRVRALWEEGLTKFGGPWLCGKEFSAADAFFAPVALRVVTYGIGDMVGEVGRRYVDLLMGLEGVKEWVEDGRKEVWREPEHEKWALGVGGRKLVEDMRETE